MSARQSWWQLQEPFVAERLQEMLDSSGVTDYEPGMSGVEVEGGTEFYVTSESRGRIKVGFLSHAEVNENLGRVILPHVETLEAAVAERTRKATAKRSSGKARNVARARELRAQGLSAAGIAVKMTAERNQPQRPPITERTVQRWLADSKGTSERRSD